MEFPNLTKISNFIKKDWLLILLALMALVLFSFFISAQVGKSMPPQLRGTAFQGEIYPGFATKEEVERKFGSPQKVEGLGTKLVYEYQLSTQKRPYEVEIVDNKVELIKEPVIGIERGKLRDYTAQWGKPEAILYSQDYSVAAPANFWGSKGITVFGNPVSGLILEIWYFAPTTLENFLQQYPELTTEEPKQF